MRSQLIITIIGTDKSTILSEIATVVSQAGCNILDSRMAVFGQDFSLTMIIDGKLNAISRAEAVIPALCQKHELLSVAKRTSEHEKQNLECLYDVEFSGADVTGILHKVTQFFAANNISISAFRQKTFAEPANSQARMTCKMVISVARDVNIENLTGQLESLLHSLGLSGSLKDNHNTKENHEHTENW